MNFYLIIDVFKGFISAVEDIQSCSLRIHQSPQKLPFLQKESKESIFNL